MDIMKTLCICNWSLENLQIMLKWLMDVEFGKFLEIVVHLKLVNWFVNR